jgi:hypothetical protein
MGCRSSGNHVAVDARIRDKPQFAAGTFTQTQTATSAGAVGASLVTNQLGFLIKVESTSQSSPACITGVRVTTESAGECNVRIGTATVAAAGERNVQIPFICECSNAALSTAYNGHLTIGCDFIFRSKLLNQPLEPSFSVKEVLLAAPSSPATELKFALTAADRETLELPITFADGSDLLSVAAKSLLLQKSTLLRAQDGVELVFKVYAHELPSVEANLTLSAKRRDAVVAFLVATGSPKDHTRGFAFGSLDSLGVGVKFEVKIHGGRDQVPIE